MGSILTRARWRS